jgi:SAM-dependent methyltransferase
MGQKKANKLKDKSKSKKPFNKHKYYEKAVQNPSHEVEFLAKEYKRLKKKDAHVFREDFGGTGYLSCTWVAREPKNTAFAVDLDPDPINYGKERHFARLTEEQQKRMKYVEDNVLNVTAPKADILCAFNFSYQIFKKRKELLEYFKVVRKSLKPDGVFFLDIFGGPESQTLMVEETEHKNFSYFWDCKEFNPITNECLFAIHFKDKGGKKRKDVFVYDWRLWGLPELRDILEDAGFSKTIAYWEGDDEDGGGDGEFYPSEKEENCQSWVTYIAALP